MSMITPAPNRIRLGILVTLAAPQLLTGAWAVLSPRSWYDTFPGIEPHLVAAQPPYNRHLATDTGAGFLATGIALAVAAVWGHRAAIHTALLAYAAFAVPHLLHHVANPAPALSSGERLLNIVLLASGPGLAAVFALGTWRAERSSALHTVAPQPPQEIKDEAQAAHWARRAD